MPDNFTNLKSDFFSEDKSNYYFPNDKFPADYFPGYKNKGNVKKMMIPNGVKKVVLRTLHTWKNLKEIRIPASVNGKDLYLSHTNCKASCKM